MKRGRPNKRSKVQNTMLDILKEMNSPLTVSSMARLASEKLNEQISWNTARKYIQELVEINKVEAVRLPHSKENGRDGLTVYMLKR